MKFRSAVNMARTEFTATHACIAAAQADIFAIKLAARIFKEQQPAIYDGVRKRLEEVAMLLEEVEQRAFSTIAIDHGLSFLRPEGNGEKRKQHKAFAHDLRARTRKMMANKTRGAL
jgi:hypothetical protein